MILARPKPEIRFINRYSCHLKIRVRGGGHNIIEILW
jgi:hypothetical protein